MIHLHFLLKKMQAVTRTFFGAHKKKNSPNGQKYSHNGSTIQKSLYRRSMSVPMLLTDEDRKKVLRGYRHLLKPSTGKNDCLERSIPKYVAPPTLPECANNTPSSAVEPGLLFIEGRRDSARTLSANSCLTDSSLTENNTDDSSPTIIHDDEEGEGNGDRDNKNNRSDTIDFLTRESFVPLSEAHKVANELLMTEIKYVDMLRLVCQVFLFEIDCKNKVHNFFPAEKIWEIFINVNSIYQFHREFLLPALSERLNSWGQNPAVGDIMAVNAPFLKMYSEYTLKFEKAMNTLSYWTQKNSKLAKLIETIQNRPDCGKLSLQHHMLGPIQRVPRYELLLKDYVKKLPDDSPDRKPTEDALKLISTAATHANEAMKKMENFKKCLDIYELLHGEADIVSPLRQFIKDSKITKLAARNGERFERYLFLFNDMLIYCESNRMRPGRKPRYHVKRCLDIDSMEVTVNSEENGTEFRVRSKQKCLDLCASSSQEREEWVEAISAAINVRATHVATKSMTRLSSSELGLVAPVWIRDDTTNNCMICNSKFTALKRRHHCRACGLVVCGLCSEYKSKLSYDESETMHRICQDCYLVIQVRGINSEEDNSDYYSGYLYVRTKKDRTWARRLVKISNGSLRCYKSEMKKKCIFRLKLKHFSLWPSLDMKDGKANVFMLVNHLNKTHHFASDTSEQAKKVMSYIQNEQHINVELNSDGYKTM